MSKQVVVSLLVVLSALQYAHAYDNGIGATPPMGWTTWCTDDLCGLIDICTETEIKSVADSMVEQGLHKLGYNFIHLDDCWSDKSRNASGHLQPAPLQFPSGMKALADYLHSLGLYLGLYTCVGTKTCHGGRPGSYGHWDIDAQTFAEWGIDLVKADNCNRPSNSSIREVYTDFSKALNRTGRPILFSLCEWGEDNVSSWGGDVGQMYRIQMDHLPFWHWPPLAAGTGLGQGTGDIIEYIGTLKPSTFVRQFAWMDPDFLETLFLYPHATLNSIDSRTEYSFWSLWSSPLLISTDIRKNQDKMMPIIANPEVIAINQDGLYTAGDRIVNATDGGQVWFKPLLDGDRAVILYNSNNIDNVTVAVRWSQLGWTDTDSVAVRDLWSRSDMGVFNGSFSGAILPHDVIFFRASRAKQ